jgi:hypothetical protein
VKTELGAMERTSSGHAVEAVVARSPGYRFDKLCEAVAGSVPRVASTDAANNGCGSLRK